VLCVIVIDVLTDPELLTALVGVCDPCRLDEPLTESLTEWLPLNVVETESAPVLLRELLTLSECVSEVLLV